MTDLNKLIEWVVIRTGIHKVKGYTVRSSQIVDTAQRKARQILLEAKIEELENVLFICRINIENDMIINGRIDELQAELPKREVK